MKTTKNILVSCALLVCAFTFTSCEKDDDKKPETPQAPSNPKEVITTVTLLMEDTLGNLVTASWKDADADGPGAPVITGLTLKAGMHYDGAVLLLDESKSPVDTISNEIAEKEAEAHQFFYTAEGGANSRLIVEREDKDKNNQPLGMLIHVDVSAGGSAAGTLKVVLKHYDGINKSTDPAVGETDVEAVFPVTIQE
ncbi:MAG: type 1 periplasmic binding fold superfamily protein [Bacteroidia bacterium]|jgi:hypothetical protein|nr:type 1 periplasmic binding fold superfamily protein [Bacteroidia bacterium]